jgi:hypothetical protein
MAAPCFLNITMVIRLFQMNRFRKIVPRKFKHRLFKDENGDEVLLTCFGEVYFLDNFTLRCITVDFTEALRLSCVVKSFDRNLFDPDGDGFYSFNFRVHELKGLVEYSHKYFGDTLNVRRMEKILHHKLLGRKQDGNSRKKR